LAATSKATSRKQSKASGRKKAPDAKTKRPKTRRKSVFKTRLTKISRFWLAGLVFLTGLTAITLVWALNLSPPKIPNTVELSSSPSAKSPPASVKQKPRQRFAPQVRPASTEPADQMRAKIASQTSPPVRSSAATGRVYEVFDTDLLEQKIKEVDLALVQTIMALHLDPRLVRHLDIQIKSRDGQKYHTQSLAIGLDHDKHGFINALRENLRQWVDGARLDPVRKDALKQEWQIVLLNLPTHTLFLEFNGHGQDPDPVTKPLKPGIGPRLVVIIDDLGESVHQAAELAALRFPVTFAVLPQSTKTREVARLAAKNGLDVLLHQPMEPRDYPHRADPGPGALFVGMPREEIKAVLSENLTQVPQAIGVNNHMGSRFTADSEGMGAMLEELKNRDLFFLDSLTTGDSVGQQQARRLGMAHLRRHIFLDNVQDVQAILFQLRKAERLSFSSKEVIAIGHPYPETLEALKIWEKERDQRIQLVSVRDFLPRTALSAGR